MELWDALYKDGTLAGRDLVRGEPVPEGLYHLVCEILVRHTDGTYLMMRRDLEKEGYPGYWETTAGGSALKGEDKLACARRELWEETGIRSDAFEEIGHYVGGDTIIPSFLCVTDCDKDSILLQEGETIDFRWANEEEFIAFVNSDEMIPPQKLRLTPWLRKMGYVK
ncbi:MAG: NUDIX domain-containing protein [Ruminococcaceae bacterium]|nr:NUDIX domain-containing protein [Oscillospiraceae bacterium]